MRNFKQKLCPLPCHSADLSNSPRIFRRERKLSSFWRFRLEGILCKGRRRERKFMSVLHRNSIRRHHFQIPGWRGGATAQGYPLPSGRLCPVQYSAIEKVNCSSDDKNNSPHSIIILNRLLHGQKMLKKHQHSLHTEDTAVSRWR